MHRLAGFGGHPFMLFFFFVVVATAALFLILMVSRRGMMMRHSGHPPATSAGSTSSEPLRLLDERFARGAVDVEDYKARREFLSNRS